MNSFAMITLQVERVVEDAVRMYSVHLPVGAPYTEAIDAVQELLQELINMQQKSLAASDAAAQAAAQAAQPAAESAQGA